MFLLFFICVIVSYLIDLRLSSSVISVYSVFVALAQVIF